MSFIHIPLDIWLTSEDSSYRILANTLMAPGGERKKDPTKTFLRSYTAKRKDTDIDDPLASFFYPSVRAQLHTWCSVWCKSEHNKAQLYV